ncbi:MAG: hypothetical protein MJ232_04770 [archaeon]|nr:hypothetical protein [archaeon]
MGKKKNTANMLNPNNNRLDYGNILSPPNNYELDFAIGTTYSLDLDSLVGASISLGLSEDTDSELINNPVYLLDALKKTGDKIALFCEGGQIHPPSKPTPLYILLEKMVFQVVTSKNNKSRYPSFHPKIWLIRFQNKETKNPLYRIIVLSRNLTFDRSWDISFTMDGEKVLDECDHLITTDKNEQLIDLLKYLRRFTKDSKKSNKISKIIGELNYIHFDLNDKKFHDFDFIVNGINDEYTIKNYPLFTDTFDEILIMSPFLTGSVINDFNQRAKAQRECILITKSMSLGKLSPEDCDNFEVYTLKDEIIDGETLISEDENEFKYEEPIYEKNKNEFKYEEPIYEKDENSLISEDIAKQDIHAKLFMVRKGSRCDLYLGSLNASHNSIYGNVEFMIRLHSKGRYLNITKLAEDIFNGEKGGKNSPFQLVSLKNMIDEETNENNHLDSVIKLINRYKPKAEIINKNNKYDIELKLNKLDSIKENKLYENIDSIKINPLLSDKEEEIDDKIVFKDLDKLQLSEFFITTIKENDETFKRVIKIPTENMPTDRENEVINSIIKDKDSFIVYVAFLLGEEYILTGFDNKYNQEKSYFTNSFELQLPALYEKMLKTAYYDPKRFKELDFLIKSISQDGVIPKGFEELYNTFEEVIK